MGSIILQEFREMITIPHLNPLQEKYFIDKYNSAKLVQVVHASEVFTLDELHLISEILRPEKNMCYLNSQKLCIMFPEKVTYCEGKVNYLLPMSHAFNKVGDKYVDITFEFALNDSNLIEYEYVVCGEYNLEQVQQALNETHYYGNVYDYFYLQHLKECPQLFK